ncbi:MAG: response regulator [Nitrospirae bacterium]|nr:MAG: response regulator [Nitrospirota bacterium]
MPKIAIIDDEPQITAMLQKALTRNKELQVSTYNNPVTALNALDRDKPDVVLLDIMMPEMDGLDALEKIKGKHPDMKVIMITAYSTLDRVLESHKIGANDYILKPFESLKVVEDKIIKCLKG